MYSENDYRYYLAHGKWEWPNGKNSPAYNHDYYSKHRDKWKEYNLAIKLGVGQAQKIAEEEERLRKWKRAHNDTKELADYAQKTGDDLAKEYKETGDIGAREGSKFAYRNSGPWKNDLYAPYDLYGKEDWYTPSTKRLSEQSNYVNMLKNQYAKTPIGKIDKATKPGRKAIQKALLVFDDAVDKLTKR